MYVIEYVTQTDDGSWSFTTPANSGALVETLAVLSGQYVSCILRWRRCAGSWPTFMIRAQL